MTNLIVFPAGEPGVSRHPAAVRSRPHVSVCVCTFRRPQLLRRLLVALSRQETGGRFTYSIVVSDNDGAESARKVTEQFARICPVPIVYCTEPEQNIALARNRAVGAAVGDYIAFIDDDEFPVPEWLRLMLDTLETRSVDGVLGPVRPHFDTTPPAWVLRGRFCDRPEHPTGTVMSWSNCRTGNVVLRRSSLAQEAPFRAEFGTGGEDVDFFQRMTAAGKTFVWCNEAIAYEVVPPSRCTRAYMLKRALLRGRNTLKLSGSHAGLITTSLVAVPVYSLCLPFTVLFGQHVFMKLLIKYCDHAGRLLAAVHLNPVRDRAH